MQSILTSEFAQKLGVSIVFLIIAWVVWQQMNIHIDGRLESQDMRITDLATQNGVLLEYIEAEQGQRHVLFTAIESHLKTISQHRQAEAAETK